MKKEKTGHTHARGQWASKMGFVLAAAGSAIGLGNIWKFPGKVGLYGGGAFLLCYILIVAVIGYPAMLAELSLGRHTQKNVVGAFAKLKKHWAFAGFINVVTPFIIMSYYCIVGGWVLKYVWAYLTGGNFGGGAEQYQTYFTNFIEQPVEPLLWGALFLALCVFVVLRGVSGGIEKVSKFLMPCLFILLIAIVVRAVTLPGALEGVKYMLTVRPEQLSADTLVGALGQAFFSLSVGMSILVTYGSYVPKEENLAKSAAWICALDTLVAVLAAFAIIPVVFITLGPENLGMGGGFAFMALPEVFANLPAGTLIGLAFFLLLFLAALTSAISILEGCVAFVSEEFRLSRVKSTLVLLAPLMLLGAGYSLSQAADRGLNLPWFDFAGGFQMLPMGTVMEKFTDNFTIPLGALLVCLFVGWVWGAKNATLEIQSGGAFAFKVHKAWEFIVRFIAPAMILVILFCTIGLGKGLS